MGVSFGMIPALEKIAAMTPEQQKEHDAWVDAENAKEAAEKKQANYEKIVPERYWGESLETYKTDTKQQADALACVRGFIDGVRAGSSKTLALLGAYGAGKTHLACGALRELGGAYRNASAIVEEIRRAKSFTSKETEAELLERYSRYSLLVVDEIGRGVDVGDERYMIYQIINARYNTRKPSILISNYDRDSFLNYIGRAAQDRLVESGELFTFDKVASYRLSLRK